MRYITDAGRVISPTPTLRIRLRPVAKFLNGITSCVIKRLVCSDQLVTVDDYPFTHMVRFEGFKYLVVCLNLCIQYSHGRYLLYHTHQ